jgi:hypothetical protein
MNEMWSASLNRRITNHFTGRSIVAQVSSGANSFQIGVNPKGFNFIDLVNASMAKL